MGGVTAAMAGRPLLRGRDHLGPVEHITVRDGQATGVVLEGGQELAAGVVVAATHPRITFLEQVDPEPGAPRRLRDRHRHGRPQHGTVEIGGRRPAAFTCRPPSTPKVHGGTIVLASRWAGAGGRLPGRGRRPGLRRCRFRRRLHPLGVRGTWPPSSHHIVSMFTQWVPCPGPAS